MRIYSIALVECFDILLLLIIHNELLLNLFGFIITIYGVIASVIFLGAFILFTSSTPGCKFKGGVTARVPTKNDLGEKMSISFTISHLPKQMPRNHVLHQRRNSSNSQQKSQHVSWKNVETRRVSWATTSQLSHESHVTSSKTSLQETGYVSCWKEKSSLPLCQLLLHKQRQQQMCLHHVPQITIAELFQSLLSVYLYCCCPSPYSSLGISQSSGCAQGFGVLPN